MKRLALTALCALLPFCVILSAPPALAAGSTALRYDNFSTISTSYSVIGKWDHLVLTYWFENGTNDIAGTGEHDAVRQAMALWEAASPVRFQPAATAASADILLRWAVGNHGDGYAFDGVNGVLAHAFTPVHGDVHFDDAESWTTSLRSGGSQPIDLVTVAAHELGHSLGLDHSDVSGALMFAYYAGSHRYLGADDVNGIRAIYGAPVTEGSAEDGRGGLSWADVSADGRSDYCRRVGGTNHVDSRVQCTLSTGTGFGATLTSGVLDWGYETGRAWVDFDGDTRADYCRRVGGTNHVDSRVQCTRSATGGFGPTVSSRVLDWGYDAGRAWVDVSADGRPDYCRRVGGTNHVDSRVQCTLSTGTGFGATVTSAVLDWGYDAGAAWVDVNGDRRADYCRRVGANNLVGSRLQCTIATGTGFGTTVTSSVLDWGLLTGRAWTDINADGRADYCRRKTGGTNHVDSKVQCTLSTGSEFGTTVTSGVLDWGYDTGREWVDVSADGRADFCRRVGGTNHIDSKVQCTLSTGIGFGTTVASGVLDWGYDVGRAWTDFNGDRRADFARRVGGTNHVDSWVQTTLLSGTGFGPTVLSGVLDWGYGN